MNILLVNSQRVDEFGGGERWVVTAAAGLRDRGHRLWVGGRPGSRLLAEARSCGLEVLPIPFRGALDPPLTWRIGRFLRRNRIDVMIHDAAISQLVAGPAARLAGTPAVFARHGLHRISRHRHYLRSRYLPHRLITNAESIRRSYVEDWGLPPDFVTVIPNGFEPPESDEIAELEAGDRAVVLAAGRLVSQKGFDVLIRAVTEMRSRRDDFLVVIAGEGSLDTDLRETVRSLELEDAVRFIGFQPDLAPLIRAATVFVLTSRYEGMPNVVLEAMALGTPVVATAVDGVVDLIPDSTCGLLVPPDDGTALARAVERLIEDPETAGTMAAAARHRARREFSTEAMLDRLEALFSETLA